MAKSKSELRQAIKDKIQAGVDLPDLKKTFAGGQLGGSTVQKIWKNNQPAPAPSPSPAGGTSSPGGFGGDYATIFENITRSQAPSPSPAEGTSSPGSFGGDYATIFENITRSQENLAHIQGGYSVQAAGVGANASVAAAGLRADADKEVARAYADAQKYSSELGLQGVKYGADKESEWRQAVANIEVKGKLDLQPIINAGLERVAGIQGQAQRDVAETTGRYGLESTKARTAADERIGKMQLAGSMYGLLGAAFG